MIVRRIGVWSVARMYGALSAVGGLIFGLILAMVALVGSGLGQPGQDMPGFVGAFFGVGAALFLPIFYGLLGLAVGALGAAVYNVLAGVIGGVEIDVN
jgi:hypothetical protein